MSAMRTATRRRRQARLRRAPKGALRLLKRGKKT